MKKVNLGNEHANKNNENKVTCEEQEREGTEKCSIKMF